MNPLIYERLEKLPHKVDVNRSDWRQVQEELLDLANWMADYCKEHYIPMVITSIIRGKIPGISTSDTHAEGRAFDVSIKGMTTDDIDDILITCNRYFAKNFGAISSSDGIARAVIYETYGHVGPFKAMEYLRVSTNVVPHLYFQVRRMIH